MSTHYPELMNQSFQTGSHVSVDGQVDVLVEESLGADEECLTITVKVGMFTIHEFTVTANQIDLINLAT